MTPEQQDKALAELDGIIVDGINAERIETLPNYRESYNAIIPLICKRGQHSILHTAYWSTATPAHLCEELLRRERKWIED